MRVNVFDHLNDQIAEFVNRRENRRLRPATGYYSTLFRGSLFGLEKAADVAERLRSRNADVLWLGTNPNCPDSLRQVLEPPEHEGDYAQFERQRQSGLYGAAQWNDDGPLPDWNPIHKPRGGWRVYRDLLTRIAPLDGVTMANFLPWGSRGFQSFLNAVAALDRPLLNRALAFSDALNVTAIGALSPALLVVPFSLGEMDRFWRSGVAQSSADEFRRHTVSGIERRFTFYTGWCHRGNQHIRTVYLRHPASLQFSTADRKRIIDEVACTLIAAA